MRSLNTGHGDISTYGKPKSLRGLVERLLEYTCGGLKYAGFGVVDHDYLASLWFFILMMQQRHYVQVDDWRPSLDSMYSFSSVVWLTPASFVSRVLMLSAMMYVAFPRP